MKKVAKFATLILAGALTFALTACGGKTPAVTENKVEAPATTAPKEEPIVVTIGTTSDDPRLWDALQEELDARGSNIRIEFKNIEGAILNEAVANGEIDLNSFQHYAYFEQVKNDQNLDLSVIGETLIVPLDLFSNKYTSLAEIPEGGKIAVPADATNQGRALHVLKNAGLIELDPAVGNSAAIKDITENPKNLEIVEIDGSQIPRSLDDVDAGVINCGYAVDAGLDINNPLYKDEIDLKNPEQQPYINIIVAKTSEVDNPVYLEVVDAYKSARVYDATIDRFNGAAIPAFEREE